ncbi:MAG: ABC transporter permease [Anaerolineae bacterium]|nr:ABC transporter permease [Anaerolineae bacterium]
MKSARNRSLAEIASLVVILTLIIIFFSQASPIFLTQRNLDNMLLDITTVGILAVFTTLLMIGGGLDLSVGSTVALCGVVIGALQGTWGILPAAAFAVAIGALVGLANGFLVTYVGINPLITTLGMLSIARGLAFVFSDGLTIPVFDSEGTQFDAYNTFTQFGEGQVFGIATPVFIMFVLFILGLLILQFTSYGRAMYAIGGNAQASQLAGLSVRRYRMIAYMLSGLSAGIAAVLLTSRLYAADPRAAPAMELTVITAVVLGGISLAGGKGTLIGTALGVLILTTLLNGMKLLSTSTDAQNIAQGVVLLLAVGLDQLRTRDINWTAWLRGSRLMPDGTKAIAKGD